MDVLERYLQSIKIVLVRPSHAGNIGACARAMKTMGLRQLHLVQPKQFPSPEATALASGAEDVLNNSQVHKSLMSAVEGSDLLLATSARSRRFPKPLIELHQLPELVKSTLSTQKIAVVFGCERTGLTQEEFMLCHKHIQIDTDSAYRSLNLSHAVQLISYMLRRGVFTDREASTESSSSAHLDVANVSSHEHLYQRILKPFKDVNVTSNTDRMITEQRLRQIFSRAQLSQMDVDFLHAVVQALSKSGAE